MDYKIGWMVVVSRLFDKVKLPLIKLFKSKSINRLQK